MDVSDLAQKGPSKHLKHVGFEAEGSPSLPLTACSHILKRLDLCSDRSEKARFTLRTTSVEDGVC